MRTDEHDLGALGSYVLGGLDEHESRLVEEHVAGCESCRLEQAALEEVRAALAEVPPEAFMDGLPEGDLVLQRTLRQVRAESARRTLRRRAQGAAVAASVVVAALVGGVLIGRSQDVQPAVTAQGPTSVAPQPAGTKIGSRSDPATGARLTVRVIPAAGWVRVHAAVAGIPAGERCRVWVIARDGTRELAGSWLVSAKGAKDGTSLDGSALVAPDDVAAVQIASTAGRDFVTVRL